MTTAAHTPAPVVTVSGTGPYTIPHAYSAAADISVRVFDGAGSVTLAPDAYSVSPASSNTGGVVTLTSASATTHAGRSLEILRSTPAVQSYQAVTSQREKQLEAVLDVLVRAQQDIARSLSKVMRFKDDIAELTVTGESMILFDGDGAAYLDTIENAAGLPAILADIADLEARVALATGISPASPLSLSIGGTGGATAAAARTSLDVPGKAAAETITGTWTVSGAWTFGGGMTFNGLITAATINATAVAIASTGPKVRVTDTDTDNVVDYGANNTQGVWSVDAGDTVANSSALIRVDGATAAVFGPGGLTVTGALSADTVAGGMLASQAQAEAGTATDVVMTPQRTAQAVAAQIPAKVVAWVKFDGTPAGPSLTPAAGHNIASVTKNSTGNYTIAFSAPMPDANYAVMAMGRDPGHFSIVTQTAAQVRIVGGVSNAYFPPNHDLVTVTVVR